MAIHPIINKVTVQAAAVAALVLTACAALFTGHITGEQFMILAVAATAWAFGAPKQSA